MDYILSKYDKNHDGTISKEEYIRLIESLSGEFDSNVIRDQLKVSNNGINYEIKVNIQCDDDFEDESVSYVINDRHKYRDINN